jgi:ferredoxin
MTLRKVRASLAVALSVHSGLRPLTGSGGAVIITLEARSPAHCTGCGACGRGCTRSASRTRSPVSHRSRVADPLEQIDVGVLLLQLDQLRLVLSLPEE